MDGVELAREVARLRAEGRAQAQVAVLWRGHPDMAVATAAECVQAVKEPLRRFDALRRRSGPEPLPVWWAARQIGGGGPLTGAR